MSVREWIVDWSKGDDLGLYWRIFFRRAKSTGLSRKFWNLLCSRMAHRHGGYIGCGAQLQDIPSLPHGLHGLYISRYAALGKGCRIYQNVTIGERDGQAPVIGDRCLIGAGAVLVGNIRIGDDVKIGGGAVVFTDIPAGSTVVAQPPRVLEGGRDA